jgi:hypothetical protein
MNTLHKLGWAAGLFGVALSAASVVVRLAGAFWIGGFQTGTLLLGGIAAMVFGCFCFLAVLTQRR